MANDKITFGVLGSSGNTYSLDITLRPFTLSCTCTAAMNGLPCKHRIKIISGKDPGITSGDVSLLPQIAESAQKTQIFELLNEYEGIKEGRRICIKNEEKVFKEYRKEFERLIFEQTTEEKIMTKYKELNEAISSTIQADVALDSVLKKIRRILN